MDENTFKPGQLYIVVNATTLSFYRLQNLYNSNNNDIFLCLKNELKFGHHLQKQIKITFLDRKNRILIFLYDIPNTYIDLKELQCQT